MLGFTIEQFKKDMKSTKVYAKNIEDAVNAVSRGAMAGGKIAGKTAVLGGKLAFGVAKGAIGAVKSAYTAAKKNIIKYDTSEVIEVEAEVK